MTRRTFTQEIQGADAFMNLVLVNKAGDEFRISKGAPLRLSNRVDAALIQKAKDNPEMTFTLTGTVTFPGEGEAVDLGDLV